jgi:hypothetical protein
MGVVPFAALVATKVLFLSFGTNIKLIFQEYPNE